MPGAYISKTTSGLRDRKVRPAGDVIMETVGSAWMRKAFSGPRIDSYIRAAGGDVVTATRLYWWNVEVSAAFYGPLHCCELAVRNTLNDRMCEGFGRADWWTNAPLAPNGLRLVDKARRRCGETAVHQNRLMTADDVVAELSFGFWVSLVSRGHAYDRNLWVPHLNRAFPYYSGPRRMLHRELQAMVLLRNRIMHHEPIHDRPLADYHAQLYRVLGYITPDAANEAIALDRVPEVLAYRNAVCSGTRPSRF